MVAATVKSRPSVVSSAKVVKSRPRALKAGSGKRAKQTPLRRCATAFEPDAGSSGFHAEFDDVLAAGRGSGHDRGETHSG